MGTGVLGRVAMMAAGLAVTGALVLSVHAPARAQVPAASPAAPVGIIESPTQVAFLHAAVRKAHRHFAREAAVISGVPADKILHMLPKANDWRAGDPRYAVVPALEKALHAPLTEDQRGKINAADREMKTAIAKARLEAAKH